MISIPKEGKIKVTWNVTNYDYSRERENAIIASFSKKYNVPKDHIKVDVKYIQLNENGEEVSLSRNVVNNIQDPQFHQKLFKDYLTMNDIVDYDFEVIKKIDAEINAMIDYDQYDKHKQYKINWVKWDNFLSYGENNYFDFRTLDGLVLLNGEPANQSGKTTFAIDLIHFLLFGKTSKSATLDKVFNKHLQEATDLIVEGSLSIDDGEYIIRRKLHRTALDKRNSKSRTTQELNYFRVFNGEMVELKDVDEIDDKQEASTTQTNKAIKEAIGNESDFDMIISTTSSNLDELIEKKDTERGRLLSRWIGLLPLERKDEIARNKFNSDIKPTLISNMYNTESLKQEISAYQLNINALKEKTILYERENKNIDKELENLNSLKESLLQAKRTVDENVLKLDITTLERSLAYLKEQGLNKKARIDEIDKELTEIGDIDFSQNEYNELIKRSGELAGEIKAHRHFTMLCKQSITDLTKSEYCPTCGRKYENIDNSTKINELNKQFDEYVVKGKEMALEHSNVEDRIAELKVIKEKFDIKANKTTQKAALEVNVLQLRESYKEQNDLLKKYNENKEAIDINNNLDIKINQTNSQIQNKTNTKITNIRFIEQNSNQISIYQTNIDERQLLIKKIEEERILTKHWRLYLDMVGKNGISKMVLRKTLPIINAQINSMLSNVCDFNVEIAVTDKNDVMFYLIKDGIRSDLSSGSGFERTAAALALRTVLGNISSMSKINFLILDEVWRTCCKRKL